MSDYRDYILIYLNGERREIRGEQAFVTLSDYLRYEQQLTGTKVVCAEGDCGACSVVVGAVKPQANHETVQYKVINACIQFMHGLDCSQIITIEGLPENSASLHPIQTAMVKAQATQCGFCTPGFVMAAAGMMENHETDEPINPQQAKNHLTGNLCRCTGYQSIIHAMTGIDARNHISLKERYHSQSTHNDLLNHTQIAVKIDHTNNHLECPTSATDAVNLLKNQKISIFAAATDLGVQYNKGHWQHQQVLNLNLIADLHAIKIESDHVSVGARVTLSELEQAIKEIQPEWADFMHVFASPQIKNNGTLIGNIANGSPIGDNLPFLLALDAVLVIKGPGGNRSVNINDFYLSYKNMDLAANELITHVHIPNPYKGSLLKLYKVSQRRDLDISCVSAAIMMNFDDAQTLQQVAIAYGGVAATPIRLRDAEHKLQGQSFSTITDSTASHSTANDLANGLTPMSDVRGSEAYRKLLISNLYLKFIDELKSSNGERP